MKSRDESMFQVSESLAYKKWKTRGGTRFSGPIPKCTFVHKTQYIDKKICFTNKSHMVLIEKSYFDMMHAKI